jgi:phosphoenolpyruvate carboxykinase (ATP)
LGKQGEEVTQIKNAAEIAGAIGRAANLHSNMVPAELVERAILRREGVIADGGAFAVETGAHTGRSPKDKFIVRDTTTERSVWWAQNNAMEPEKFSLLLSDFLEYAEGRELFAQDLYCGADPACRIRTRVLTEYAWHALFIRDLLIRVPAEDLAGFAPDLTIIDFPGFRADPARHGARTETIIACDFTRAIVLIGGTSYAGEMKKAAFTYLNFTLPPRGIMPMHCSANVGPEGDTAIFFGLSGTGKTTLSADPARTLIGDDEHGWGRHGIFNFEGGCYAKTIRLSAEAEPDIYAATRRFGTVLENVIVDPQAREIDYDDDRLTENTRAAYPLDFIANASLTGRAGHPRNIVFLTADAFGVMPPIAKLSPAQAIYHFLSGYTAKVAGTEKGVTEPQATFSACFGAPFMPRNPAEYGRLLRDFIATHAADCWLINTGWTGGAYGTGRRMPIRVTRALLAAALDGSLRDATFYTDRNFGFLVPTDMPGIEPHLFHPRKTWADKPAYDAQAAKLVKMFVENFGRFEESVDGDVLAAAPRAQSTA